MTDHHHRTLELTDTTSDEARGAGGCGCGGCGCGDSSGGGSGAETQGAITQAFSVTGMTCGHCATAVTEELLTLPGVVDVRVELVPGGDSTVTVVSDVPVDRSAVASAVAEAGDYQLG